MKRLPSKSKSCTHLRKLKINSDKINLKSESGQGGSKKNKTKLDDFMKQLAKD